MGAGFSQSDCLLSQRSSSELSVSEDLFSGTAPEVVVVSEGDASPPVPPQIVLDDRFNQLDELNSQSSRSIPSNCGPGAAPPGGESVGSQITNSSSSCNSISPNCRPGAVSSGGELSSSQIVSDSTLSQSILANCGPDAASSGGESGNSQITNSSSSSKSISPNCGPGAVSSGGELSSSQINSNSVSNVGKGKNNQSNLSRRGSVNYYGPAVRSDSTPPGPPSVVADSEMSQASDPRKRPPPDDVSKSKGANKKVSRRSTSISHIPTSVVSAARLVSTRLSKR